MKSYNEMAESVFRRREEYRKMKKMRLQRTKKVASIVASLVVIVVLGLGLQNMNRINTTKSTTPNTQGQNGRDNAEVSKPIPSSAGHSETNNKGIYIDRIELPSESSATLDMIGLIVYHSNIYTQTKNVKCSKEQQKALIGAYLGTAVGNLDEWSKRSEYSKELASSAVGKVYKVNGYDDSFRIGIPYMYEGEYYITFYENLNGITLSTGKDLYENRLLLKENYRSTLYQLHSDWNNDANQYKELKLSRNIMLQFIDAIDSSPFIELDNSSKIYNSKMEVTHLYFKLKDGTTLEVGLFEKGFVAYGNLIVKVSDKIFSKVFQEAMK